MTLGTICSHTWYACMVTSHKTVCCSNQEVAYHWRFAPPGRHVEDTVAACMDVLTGNGYIFNDTLEADCEAQIEELLELAMRGELEPVKHVKKIHGTPFKDMYEMRWQDIAVVVQDRVSGLKDKRSVLLRLYYIEEGGPWVVGVHVHEKKTDGTEEEITQAQNEEIQIATNFVMSAESDNWGVSELAGIRQTRKN